MANTAAKVFSLIEDTVRSCGVNLWDVRFLKEGASHYLRVYIDKPEGVTIDDCTNVSHAIDPIIDEADPIDVSYYLEVCSAGLNRELKRPEHFECMIGSKIELRLFKALDGKKEFSGMLKAFDGGITLLTEEGEMKFDLSLIAKANTVDEL